LAVEVRIPTVFRKYTEGRSLVEVDSGTLAEVIEQLNSTFPGFKEQVLTESGDLHRFVNVYLNDEDVRYLEKLNTEITDGDTVSLLPSVAGG
jgi:sulfur-carrier protein